MHRLFDVEKMNELDFIYTPLFDLDIEFMVLLFEVEEMREMNKFDFIYTSFYLYHIIPYIILYI